MRRARDPQKGVKLPFDKEPSDREGSYRKPVDLLDAFRLVINIGAVVGAGLWFKFATEDRTAEGAKLLVAVGAVAAISSALDLIALRRGKLEQIFLGPEAQHRARVVILIAGLIAVVAGVGRMTAV